MEGLEKKRYVNDLSCKENQIMRVVLNDWKLIDYYIDQTLDYCKRSHILSNYEIEHLKIDRIDKYQQTN